MLRQEGTSFDAGIGGIVGVLTVEIVVGVDLEPRSLKLAT